MSEFEIRPLGEGDREWAAAFLEERWGSTRMVSRGRLHEVGEPPGFVALVDGEPMGLLTHRVDGGECEIVLLDAGIEGKGIGSALIEAAKEAATAQGCARLCVITTNDNLEVLRFYQRRGFAIASVRTNALEQARELKPEIPLIGKHGIPLRDEIELETRISALDSPGACRPKENPMSGDNADDIYTLVSEFYDHVVPYRTRQDVDFFVEMAKETGGPVLEIGCGSGRVLIPTARTGVEIAGLDLSPAMLALCRKALEKEPKEVQARVRLFEGDMRHFHIGGEFALATTPFRPFQHILKVEDQITCLRSIRGHLAEGGRLVLDLFNPDLNRLVDAKYLKHQEMEPEFLMPDGRKVVRAGRNISRNLADQIVEVELAHYVTHPDGREEVLSQQFRLRYFFRYEVEHLLARAGFRVEQLYGDYDKSPFGAKEPGEMIFVAQKV